MLSKQQIGTKGEELAYTYFTSQKYSFIGKNIRTKSGEIDLIFKKNNIYYFIEVKTRTSLDKGYPYESVTQNKQMHMKRAIQWYVLQNKLQNYKLSIKVVSILLDDKLNQKMLKEYDFWYQ